MKELNRLFAIAAALVLLVIVSPVQAEDGEVAGQHCIPITQDFDGDGGVDILWRNSESGRLILWRMQETQIVSRDEVQNPGLVWRIIQIIDRNRDCKADILWRNVETARVVVWYMDGPNRIGAETVLSPSQAWAVVPVPLVLFEGDDTLGY